MKRVVNIAIGALLSTAALAAYAMPSDDNGAAAGDEPVDVNEVVNWVPPAQVEGNSTGDTDWPLYNRTLDGHRYTLLDQIDTSNVSQLEEACRVRVAGPGPLSAGPILIDGAMYVTTSNAVTALDATNCDVVWKSIYSAEARQVFAANRGAAYLDGMVFRGTPDARLVAYDAKTGAEKWRSTVGDPELGEYVSSAPIAWEGKVFVGLAGSEWGIRGRMMAFDAETGKQLWSFNTIPQAGEFGNETWAGESWKLGGGGTWSSYALDTETGELFVPVANPAPDFIPEVRRGDNLFTNAILVLDARTGKRKWHYQTIKNDSHDYGVAPPAVLIERDGRPVVAQGSKDGYVYMVDRKSRKLVWKTPVTTILNHQVVPTVEGIKVCPGTSGGVEYNSPAYDPENSQLIVGAVDWCSNVYRDAELKYDRGLLYLGGTNTMIGEGRGWITALDARTGKVNWKFQVPAPVVTGITPTSGGVTFAGDIAGNLYALRSKDGEILARWNTGGSLAGGIITYRRGGRQYVALTSGNVSRLAFAGIAGTPSIVIYRLPESLVAGENKALTADIERGAVVYANLCASCHGGQGEGLVGPHLRGIAARYTQEQAVAYLKNPSGAMPRLYPSPMTEQDVADVAAFMLEFEE